MPRRTTPRFLQTKEVIAIYDRHGARADGAAWYEDAALDLVVTHGGFERARSVLELGSGSGRFATRLLDEALPDNARYTAVDLSETMAGITGERLARFGPRATVHHAAVNAVELPEGGFDRVVSTYMLDIFSPEAIAQAFDRCHRWLRPGGRLCLAGLTPGERFPGTLIGALWSQVHRWTPRLVGGCRPLRQAELLDERRWAITERLYVQPWGIPSEVLIADRLD